METDSRKYTILSFLVLAGLTGYVLFLTLTAFADAFRFGGSNVWMGQPWSVIGGGIAGVGGLATFIALMLNQKATSFGDECFNELKKVTWPTLKETSASTLVVSIMTVIAALMFLVMDLLWGNLFELIL